MALAFTHGANGQPAPKPWIDVERILKMKPADAVAELKASGRWAEVKWFPNGNSISLESPEHLKTGMSPPNIRGADGVVSYFHGRLVEVYLRNYPGPDAGPYIFRSLLGISAAPPKADFEFRNQTMHGLEWKHHPGEPRFGPVYRAETHHLLHVNKSESTFVAVELADEATMKAWKTEKDAPVQAR